MQDRFVKHFLLKLLAEKSMVHSINRESWILLSCLLIFFRQEQSVTGKLNQFKITCVKAIDHFFYWKHLPARLVFVSRLRRVVSSIGAHPSFFMTFSMPSRLTRQFSVVLSPAHCIAICSFVASIAAVQDSHFASCKLTSGEVNNEPIYAKMLNVLLDLYAWDMQ